MYLEQEVYSLLIWGFALIAFLSVLVLILLYLKCRNRHIFWFGGQVVFLTLAFCYFYKAISYLPNQGNSMYSEMQSVNIALAGIFWAASMVFVLIGVSMLLRKRT